MLKVKINVAVKQKTIYGLCGGKLKSLQISDLLVDRPNLSAIDECWQDVFKDSESIEILKQLVDGPIVYAPNEQLFIFSDFNTKSILIELRKNKKISWLPDRKDNISAFAIHYDFKDKFIYFLGGMKRWHPSAYCVKINVYTQEWKSLPDLVVARYRAGTFITKDQKHIYCFKGCKQDGSINSYERLNI